MAVYNGTAGDDFYRGTAGTDYIYGNGGADNLRGQGGDDFLYGGDGDDYLRGEAGVDYYDGGAGFDRISFVDTGATQGIIADLRRQLILNDGHGNRETIVSIEALGGGTVFSDVFHGNDVANMLLGGYGDKLFGHGGDDQIGFEGIENTFIDGGEGRDLLAVQNYRDVLNESGQIETQDATSGVVVDLARQLIQADGFGASGRIRGIEDFSTYSVFDSRLKGSDEANGLSTGSGDDQLYGRGGDDVLGGGSGADSLFGEDGDDVLIGGEGKDKLTGGAGADLFSFAGFANQGVYFVAGQQDPVTFYAPADSGANQKDADRIVDFSSDEGDLIDLSAIDALTQLVGGFAPDDAFVWRGKAGFTGAGGEARYQIRGGDTFIYLDIGGEDGGNMVIRLDGVHALVASDFVL